MDLFLSHTQALSINLRIDENQNVENRNKSLLLDFVSQFNEEVKDSFSILFDINVKHPGEFNLQIDFIAVFKTSEPFSDNFKNSPFTKVNAPAIAYPFLRSLVSTVLLNAGYRPAILPSINFTKFKHKEVES